MALVGSDEHAFVGGIHHQSYQLEVVDGRVHLEVVAHVACYQTHVLAHSVHYSVHGLVVDACHPLLVNFEGGRLLVLYVFVAGGHFKLIHSPIIQAD